MLSDSIRICPDCSQPVATSIRFARHVDRRSGERCRRIGVPPDAVRPTEAGYTPLPGQMQFPFMDAPTTAGGGA